MTHELYMEIIQIGPPAVVRHQQQLELELLLKELALEHIKKIVLILMEFKIQLPMILKQLIVGIVQSHIKGQTVCHAAIQLQCLTIVL